jgi:hypothetical protein
VMINVEAAPAAVSEPLSAAIEQGVGEAFAGQACAAGR